MEAIFGSITMFLSLAAALIGFPSQIRKNYSEKRCGISFPLIVLPLAVFVSRAIYASSIGSWYIAIPDFLGIVLMLVLLVQFIMYRRK